MGNERYLPGLWTKFCQWAKLSARIDSNAGKLVYKGQDLNGNVYFEAVDKSGRWTRVVEPKQFDPTGLPSLPEIVISPEWLRWLRKNRDDPPTEEEMVRNAALAYLKKKRAAELEAEERKNWPELDAKLKKIEAESYYHKLSLFPVYRDLEVTAGQSYMLNRGFYVPDLSENEAIQLEQGQRQKLSAGDDKKDNGTSNQTKDGENCLK